MYYGGVSSLGQDPTESTIRWWCWDVSGFKDCHAKQWDAGRAFCQQTNSAGYTSMEVCQNKETDARAKANCSCPSSPPAKGAASTTLYVIGFAFIGLMAFAGYREYQHRKR
jgi:hypothetical protein